MGLEHIVDDGGRTGVTLRRHRGTHEMMGKGQCRRLATLLPSLVKDNGSAAMLPFTFVEWLVAPILFPDGEVKVVWFYRFAVGIERMGIALECAIAKIKDDKPRAPAVLRAQLRRVV